MAVLTGITSTEQDQIKQNKAINQIVQFLNSIVTGTVTLTPSATTTTVLTVNCTTSSLIFLTPQTSDAANDMATTWVVAGSGQFVIHHANNARVDRTFGWECRG
jgi:hypothetical protein